MRVEKEPTIRPVLTIYFLSSMLAVFVPAAILGSVCHWLHWPKWSGYVLGGAWGFLANWLVLPRLRAWIFAGQSESTITHNGEDMPITITEPAVVDKVRELLKSRINFESGKSYSGTFAIYRTTDACWMRIGDKWAILDKEPFMQPTGDDAWDRRMRERARESADFNDLGIPGSDDKRYSGGFVHGNCQRLADGLGLLGFLTADEVEQFKRWSRHMIALDSLRLAQDSLREAESKLSQDAK